MRVGERHHSFSCVALSRPLYKSNACWPTHDAASVNRPLDALCERCEGTPSIPRVIRYDVETWYDTHRDGHSYGSLHFNEENLHWAVFYPITAMTYQYCICLWYISLNQAEVEKNDVTFFSVSWSCEDWDVATCLTYITLRFTVCGTVLWNNASLCTGGSHLFQTNKTE